MPRGIPRHVTGERVRMALVEARPNGLSTQRLADVSGLTVNQVRTGLTEIREEAALANNQPLTWSRANGYKLPRESDELLTYTQSVAGTFHKRLIRLMKGTVLPSAQLLPDEPWVDIVTAQLNAATASLQMAISYQIIVPRPARKPASSPARRTPPSSDTPKKRPRERAN
jgi:hypothetical protein